MKTNKEERVQEMSWRPGRNVDGIRREQCGGMNDGRELSGYDSVPCNWGGWRPGMRAPRKKRYTGVGAHVLVSLLGKRASA